MTDTVKTPEDCETMFDVRAGVDETDRQLIALLETRFGYMRAAARIKQERGAVRDEKRKASVIRAAGENAQERGLPRAEIEQLWDGLVEASIAYELELFDRLKSTA